MGPGKRLCRRRRRRLCSTGRRCPPPANCRLLPRAPFPLPLQGTARCLRTALAALIGGDGSSGAGGEHSSLLGYAAAARAAIGATVSTAFHEKSYWTAAALLDVSALWAVFRRHKTVAAEAAAAASLRQAAADPGNEATHLVQPAAAAHDLPLLRCAAVHAKASYGAPAASGHVSSAAGYAALLTIHQAT